MGLLLMYHVMMAAGQYLGADRICHHHIAAKKMHSKNETGIHDI